MIETMLDRIVSLATALEGERGRRMTVEDELRRLHQTPAPRVMAEPAEVLNLIRCMQGDKFIEAIKSFRTLTGQGLKEAKDAVESVRVKSPPCPA